MRTTIVYCLIDSQTKKPFYVGASQRIISRLQQHISDAISKTGNLIKGERIRTLLSLGIEIEILTLCSCDPEDSHVMEKHWIDTLRMWGFDLTNVNTPVKIVRSETDAQPIYTATNIKALRSSMHKTQSELAEMLNIKRSLLGAYEESRATPNHSVLFKLAELSGKDVKDLLYKDLSNELTALIKVA